MHMHYQSSLMTLKSDASMRTARSRREILEMLIFSDLGFPNPSCFCEYTMVIPPHEAPFLTSFRIRARFRKWVRLDMLETRIKSELKAQTRVLFATRTPRTPQV